MSSFALAPLGAPHLVAGSPSARLLSAFGGLVSLPQRDLVGRTSDLAGWLPRRPLGLSKEFREPGKVRHQTSVKKGCLKRRRRCPRASHLSALSPEPVGGADTSDFGVFAPSLPTKDWGCATPEKREERRDHCAQSRKTHTLCPFPVFTGARVKSSKL